MNLIPWSRRDTSPTQFRTLREEFDDFFGPLFGSLPSTTALASARSFLPLINVSEDEENVTVTADLPGIDKKDVDVQVNGEFLTLHGERREQSQSKGENWWRKESSYGAFTRRIALPCEVDAAHTDATMKDGVLTIKMAKAPGTKAKSIKVE